VVNADHAGAAGTPGRGSVIRVLRISTRNARFQQWRSLLVNRAKRQRAGLFLVHGVRPITLAVEHGWHVDSLIHPSGQPLSSWAGGVLDRSSAERVAMAPELLAELGERDDGAPELVAVVRMPADDPDRIEPGKPLLVVVFDRPASPGNIGSLVRSADAFGAGGVIVTGHAADVYDPKCVRASTGSLFSIPVVRTSSHREVVDWVARRRAAGSPIALLGLDEQGAVEVAGEDLTGPVVLVVGNETVGLSAGWRAACDRLVRIPIGGAASSLNAAAAGSIVLYEATRQRSALTS
jgi:TrmH family RNA methyltransferase